MTRTMSYANLLAGLGTMAALVGTTGTAQAYYKLCNRAHETIYAAIAYNGDTAPEGIISQGWWTLTPGQCLNVLSGSVRHKHVRLFGENADGSRIWAGGENFCVDPSNAFTIYNAQATADCAGTKNFRLGSYGFDNITYSFTP